MKTVVIIGGAGFIGANLCNFFLSQNKSVLCVDNLITSSNKNIQQFKNNKFFTFINHDITKPFPEKFFDKQFLHIDSIFHLACPTGVPNLTRLSEEMLMTCSVGTKHVLDLALFHQVPVLLASSSEVYGDPLVTPQTENYSGNVDTLGIRSPYEEGKRFAESLLSLYVKKYHLDGKIVRIFNTYGPFMSLSDSRVIPYFISQLKENQPLSVAGEGSQTRTFCYVDDLIQGFFIVMQKGEKGEAYNLGSDKETTIKHLAEKIRDISHKNLSFKYVIRPSHDHQTRHPSLQKVKALGWQETVSLSDGLQKTLQWYGL